MATILAGLVDDSDVLADERVVDMTEAAYQLDSDTSQFSTILEKLPQKAASNSEIKWREDQFMPTNSTLGANVLVGDGTITVATGDGAIFNVKDQVKILSSGETVYVTSIAGDVLTVTRSIGSVAAAAATSGDKLLIVANASGQGADTPASRVVKRVLGFNYTQIVRHSFSFTRTVDQAKTYGGSERDVERTKKLVEHKRALEYMLTDGARDLQTDSDGESLGFCGGAKEFITTNKFNVGGALSASYFESKMASIFAHGDAGSKVVFAGPTAQNAMSNWLLGKWAPITTQDKLYGAYVDGYISGSFGYRVPVFVKRNWFSNGLDGQLLVIDLSLVKKRAYQDTVLLRNRQGNGQDRITEEYLTEMSLEFAQEEAHGLFTGITG